MSIRSYYRRALLLPIAVPLLAWPTLLTGSGVLEGIVFYLWWSLIIGGVPYLLFATGFVLWSRGRSDAEVRRGVLLSPLVYTALLLPWLVLFLAVDSAVGSSMDLLAFCAAFGVGFGYGYVALAELGRLLFRPGAAVPQPLPGA